MNQSSPHAFVLWRVSTLLGPGVLKGHRFLARDGDDSPLWRGCGEAIEAAALRGHLPAMIATANATFLAFEARLDGAHQEDKIDGENF